MAEKENKQKHKSTIDKYFRRTADGFKAWAEEDGNQGFDFHIAYHGKTAYLADGIAQAMQRDKFLRTIVITAARKFFFDK